MFSLLRCTSLHPQDLRAEIERVAAFLGRCISKEELDKLTEHLGFDSFSRNLSVNYEMGKQLGMLNLNGRFMRKGIFNHVPSLTLLNVWWNAQHLLCCYHHQDWLGIGRITLARNWTIESTVGLTKTSPVPTWNSWLNNFFFFFFT